MKRALGFVLSASSVLSWQPSAYAQSDRELATRQELLEQAMRLSDDGKHAEALALGKRAEAIKTTTSLRMFLAQQQVALSLLADAYGNARQCAVEAQVDARLNDRDRILAVCQELEASLGKRVGRVTINIPNPPPSLHVTVSGEDLNPSLLGTPYVVSPGPLTIVATAPGFLTSTSTVDVPEGSTPEVDLKLEPDPSAQPCPASEERVHGVCVAPASASPASFPTVPTATHAKTTWVTLAVVIGGVGLASVVVGAISGGMAIGALGNAESECPTYSNCSPQAMSDHDTTVTLANVSTATFIAGGVLLAAGMTIFFAAPKHSPSKVGLVLAPRGLGLVGTF